MSSRERCLFRVVAVSCGTLFLSVYQAPSASSSEWNVDWSDTGQAEEEPEQRSLLGVLHNTFGAGRDKTVPDNSTDHQQLTSDPATPSRGMSLSIGSYFGEPTSDQTHYERRSFTSSGEQHHELDLDRPGGTWTFIDLPMDKVKSIHSIQFGGFSVGGLGLGNQSESSSIGVEVEKTTTEEVRNACGVLVKQSTTQLVTEQQNFSEASNSGENLGGLEFNVVFDDPLSHKVMSGLKTFAGARFINVGNDYSGSTSSAFAESGDGSADTLASSVTNRLVGAQFGVSGRKRMGKNVILSGRLAFGAFANFIDRDSNFSTTGTSASSFNNNGSDNGFAQMVEFSPTMHVRLQEKMYLSFGGTVMWLNGISQVTQDASSALRNGDGGIQDDDSYLFYGAKATFNWKFN